MDDAGSLWLQIWNILLDVPAVTGFKPRMGLEVWMVRKNISYDIACTDPDGEIGMDKCAMFARIKSNE